SYIERKTQHWTEPEKLVIKWAANDEILSFVSLIHSAHQAKICQTRDEICDAVILCEQQQDRNEVQ
ncbi:MAG: hypothetical protein ABIR84_01885, partial [Candidatus Nitrotoga sp.]